jgi:rod shape-determining protein mreC
MHNLLLFFLKWRPWMLFCIYVVISCILLFNNNPYQHSVYLTSANALTTSVYEMAYNVTSYFNLRGINEDLQRQNAQLERDLLAARQQIRRYQELEYAAGVPVDSSLSRYDFIIAHVINNSVNRAHNYITIEKGELDGIKPEMGVVDQNGIVGKVNVVGPHSARVISLLNNYLRISSKIKGSQQVGSLVWDGEDYREAVLEELPRHSTFNIGDTIVTSGYSSSFPEGVPVGVITEELKDYDENFLTLRVRLFTDFSQLSTVRVVVDYMADELKTVEADPDDEEKK